MKRFTAGMLLAVLLISGVSTALDQLSRFDSQGTSLGQSILDKISFYNATPVVQPSGRDQSALSRNNGVGVVASYSSTQSPSAVAQSTTAEQSLTIQSGSGGQMLLAAGDVVYVNKPTSQAGLGVGNARVVSSNTLGLTFDNLPAGGNITPTASQVYSVVAVRGLATISATLSPAAVAANSTVEQQFNVVGLIAGQLVQVTKPTAQAGLDIAGVRVVAKDTLGITFMNTTAAPVTPTASEAYVIAQLAGLDAQGNELTYGFNVGTVGAIGVGVVATGGSTTLTGMLATDVISGVFKPTTGAVATNAAFVIGGIPTANTLTLYFGGIGTGATPTGSEVYGIHTYRLNPVAPLKLYTPSLAPVSVATLTCAEQTFTVTGLISGSPAWVNKPSAQAGLGIAGVRVSATDTLAINYCNTSGVAIVPSTETYVVGNFQVPSPGAGNVAYQTVSPEAIANTNLTAALRSALVSLGLIAGQ